MAKEGEKDVKVEEDAAKAKYSFSKIYDYVVHKTYPSHADKLYNHGLRKCSKFIWPWGMILSTFSSSSPR